MIKDVLTYPKDKEILMTVSEKVSPDDVTIPSLIQDLRDTLNQYPSGVGISAIQIGIPKRVCLIKIDKKEYVLINPYITKSLGMVKSVEGCLSAPDTSVTIRRKQKIWINYIDENGNKQHKEEGGLFSIVAQHELEHFDGWCKVFDGVKEEEK